MRESKKRGEMFVGEMFVKQMCKNTSAARKNKPRSARERQPKKLSAVLIIEISWMILGQKEHERKLATKRKKPGTKSTEQNISTKITVK